MALASPNDRRVIGALAWAGAKRDPQYASLAMMQKYAQSANVTTSIPGFIDPYTSFVLRDVSGEQLLEQASWFEAHLSEPVVWLEGDNWKMLAQSLKENEEQLEAN